MCYAILACATDYDCWHDTEEAVSVEMVVANLLKNVATSKEILRRLVPLLPQERTCPCASALKDAIITAREAIPWEAKERLAPLINKYLQ